MTGYFGDEPTCRHCDYPQRLHHLLRVDHEYAPGQNENAAAARTRGDDGTKNRSNTQEGTDSTVSVPVPTTEAQPIPATIATLVNVIGVFALAIGLPKPGPVKLNVITSTGRNFHLATAGTVQEITAFARRHATRCAEILGPVEFEDAPTGLVAAYPQEELFYRWEQPTPEAGPDDVGDLETLASVQIGDCCEVTFDRFTDPNGIDDQVAFSAIEPGGDGPYIRPDEIPALVDELLEMHRTWLQLVAADEADADVPIDLYPTAKTA